MNNNTSVKTNSNKNLVPRNLISPPAAQTDTSIALIWDKPTDVADTIFYEVYLNEKLIGTSKITDYTIKDLASSVEYEVFVRAVLKNGETSLNSNTIKVITKPKVKVFDITDFGAVGDGITLNTCAISDAINACTQGGMVYVPKGIFITGAIFLKSNMTLFIEEGGVLLGSDDTADYPLMNYRFEGLETICYASLINTTTCEGERLENITVAGTGKIDANGTNLRKKEITENKGKPGRAICIRNADHVYLYNITVKQSPAWCVHFIYCNHVSVNTIKIFTKQDEDGTRYKDIVNGDGLNPDSTSDVYIFNTMIASQDDCIAIKSGRNEEGREVGIPSENIRITNCRFRSGFGVAVGSEMSGSVRNVFVQDCDYEDVYSIGSIKAPRGRGGIVDNITYKDITFKNYGLSHKDCEWFRGAIYIDQFYSHITFDIEKLEEVNDGTSIIQNIKFENIRLDTLTGNAIYLTGLPESPLKNIQLHNISATGKYGLKANNIRGFIMTDVSVKSREDENYIYNNVE
jgi:polygalacturonase